jgi:tetratricopeptide (TPR) repeat protein
MNDQDLQLIEAYLDGSLQGAGRKEFEQRLQQEEALANQLALHREVDLRLEAMQKEQLTADWKAHLEEHKASGTGGKSARLPYRSLAIAATVLVLIAAAWWVFRPVSSAVLADNYWDQSAQFAYTDIDRSTDPNTPDANTVRQAYKQFQSGDFALTVQTIQSISQPTDELLLLQGAAHFKLGNYQAAQTSFQSVLDQPQSLVKDEARWYLALVLLKNNDKKAATALLQEIVAKQSWNVDRAIELLDQISE